MGALRLLAESYAVEEVNSKGFSLYADFRPKVEGWGGRGEVRCETILALRKHGGVGNAMIEKSRGPDEVVKYEKITEAEQNDTAEREEEPEPKKARVMTLEEYEATLDRDMTFDDMELNQLP
jgi:hypothetical protein